MAKKPEQLVTMKAEIPERTRLKMQIAQAVRDLDEAGLHVILDAIAAQKTGTGELQEIRKLVAQHGHTEAHAPLIEWLRFRLQTYDQHIDRITKP